MRLITPNEVVERNFKKVRDLHELHQPRHAGSALPLPHLALLNTELLGHGDLTDPSRFTRYTDPVAEMEWRLSRWHVVVVLGQSGQMVNLSMPLNGAIA